MESAPIFIIGESRSGKSLLEYFLAIHRETCWFSNYTNTFYHLPYLAFLNRVYNLPILGHTLKKRLIQGKRVKPFPRPNEGNAIYYRNCKMEDKRWVTEKELTLAQKEGLQRIVANHCRFSGCRRFINDESANVQRIRQISTIFPDAYFIHMIRDGRAVSNEIYHSPWWQQRKMWWYGDSPGSWQDKGPEPILLCAQGWKYAIETIRHNNESFKDRYLEVRYEELVANPPQVLETVRSFCTLSRDPHFKQYIPMSIPSNNQRWQQELSPRQKEVLYTNMGDFLLSLGYS